MPPEAHCTEQPRDAAVIAVVQARMSSTRLPGKVLRPLGDRSVLRWVLRAALAATAVDEVVVATSTDTDDDAVVAEAARVPGVRTVRGSREDVLSRFMTAVEAVEAGTAGAAVEAGTAGTAATSEQPGGAPGRPVAAVVRLTADCPLLDPAVIDLVARTWRASPMLDHLATTNPRCLPRGLDVEVVSRRALADVATYADGPDRVHVTSAVYRQPQRYAVAGLCLHPAADDLRVTLDTGEDAALLDALVPLLPAAPPPWRAVVAALRAQPELAALNGQVRQKEWSEG